MDRTLDSVRNGYKLCILGDLNGSIGDRRAGITGAFEVPGENDNLVEEWWSGGVKSMIDLVLVRRNMLRYVQDVRG